ncbi:hypothetical protein DFH28DRAFT_901287, partial [Melampsora americana]
VGNRRCKSESSFERHKLSCTHRMGPLRLECKYCKRPYTYVGYLAKHETECEKMHPVSCILSALFSPIHSRVYYHMLNLRLMVDLLGGSAIPVGIVNSVGILGFAERFEPAQG